MQSEIYACKDIQGFIYHEISDIGFCLCGCLTEIAYFPSLTPTETKPCGLPPGRMSAMQEILQV